MPLIKYCYRCQEPHHDLTHCHSVDNYLCEECIIILATEYFERYFVVRRPSPPITPEVDDNA